MREVSEKVAKGGEIHREIFLARQQMTENKTFKSLFAFLILTMVSMALSFSFRLLPAVQLLTCINPQLLINYLTSLCEVEANFAQS